MNFQKYTFHNNLINIVMKNSLKIYQHGNLA
jgi:hypothetical protein